MLQGIHCHLLAPLVVCCGGLSYAADVEVVIPGVRISVIDDVEIPAQETGVLSEVLVAEGEVVEQGQLIARIQDAEAVVAAHRARTELETAQVAAENDIAVRLARKALAVAQAEYARAEETNDSVPNTISGTELDKLRLTRDRVELEIEQAELNQSQLRLAVRLKEQDVALADLAVARRQILAPVAGRVVQVPHQVGEWVQPGEPTARVVDTRRLRAEAFLKASEVPGDPTGRSVRVTLETSSGVEHFDGRIEFVDPEINPVTGEYRVWAIIENRDDMLRPGIATTMTLAPASAGATTPPPAPPRR